MGYRGRGGSVRQVRASFFAMNFAMKRLTFAQIFLLIFMSANQWGCIRLWGGAGYTREKPGETVQKTYILDTYQFTNTQAPKDNASP